MPPINQAVNDGLLDDPIFTVWLKNSNSEGAGANAGTITFGDIDGDHCGFIMDYVPLSAEKYWQFPILEVTIGGETIKNGWNAISSKNFLTFIVN